MSKSRAWCFTVNGDLREEPYINFGETNRVRYGVWQLESAPTTDSLHLQGYVEFVNAVRRRTVQQVLGYPTAHVEPRKGSREQAIEYCKKCETRRAGPWEYGSLPRQGERKDLYEVAELIESGAGIQEVRSLAPVQYIRYRRGIEALCFASCRERSQLFRKLEVYVLYGDAGAGKTRHAVESAGDAYYILDQSGGDRVWFDGYEGEPVLLIDDFYGWIKYGFLLRILDGYQLRLEVKGGFTYALWTKVFITSNKHPQEWYSQGLSPALKRRITKITHFSNLVNNGL